MKILNVKYFVTNENTIKSYRVLSASTRRQITVQLFCVMLTVKKVENDSSINSPAYLIITRMKHGNAVRFLPRMQSFTLAGLAVFTSLESKDPQRAQYVAK